MNKKEISEIKRIYTISNCSITRICGCYVDAEKNILTTKKEAFLSLPEEEVFKYFELLRKGLSGSLDKNLLNMEFPLEEEKNGVAHDLLLKLRNSHLKDNVIIDQFYQAIIESYDCSDNYYIIVIHCVYDIPNKASDNIEIFDGSESVYDFIHCIICPVKLSKPALCYNKPANTIENYDRDWLVGAPDQGFLFPAFNDRETDIHGLLYYSKNPEAIASAMIDKVFGCKIPMSAKSQKETFQTLVEDVLGEKCDFETVRTIYENLNEMIEEAADSSEPLLIDSNVLKQILEDSGATEDGIEMIDDRLEEDNFSLPAINLVNTKKTQIETASVVIKSKIVDGKQCIVIEVDGNILVDGINTKAINLSK